MGRAQRAAYPVSGPRKAMQLHPATGGAEAGEAGLQAGKGHEGVAFTMHGDDRHVALVHGKALGKQAGRRDHRVGGVGVGGGERIGDNRALGDAGDDGALSGSPGAETRHQGVSGARSVPT